MNQHKISFVPETGWGVPAQLSFEIKLYFDRKRARHRNRHSRKAQRIAMRFLDILAVRKALGLP